MYSHLQASRVPSHIKVTSEDKYSPSWFLLHPTLYAEHDATGCGIPLESIEASCLGSVLSTPLYPLLGGATKALSLRKPCLSVTGNALYYHHCFKCKSKTQPYTSHCEENYPSNPVHSLLLTSHNLHHAVHDLIESNWQPSSPPHPLIQYTDIIPSVYGHPL